MHETNPRRETDGSGEPMERRRVLVAYATREGQTAKVTDHVADVLRDRGLDVTVARLDTAEAPDPAAFDGVLLAGSVHMGRHDPDLARFVAANLPAIAARPSGFLSLSLSAASPETAHEADRMLSEFLAEAGWTPDEALTVAGALRYTQYGWLTRLLIRRIARKNRGSTDTSRDHEYTDWDAVAAFARRFADRVAAAGPATDDVDAASLAP